MTTDVHDSNRYKQGTGKKLTVFICVSTVLQSVGLVTVFSANDINSMQNDGSALTSDGGNDFLKQQ